MLLWPKIFTLFHMCYININNGIQSFTNICWKNSLFCTPNFHEILFNFNLKRKPNALSYYCSFNMSSPAPCSCTQLKIQIMAKQMVLMSTVASSRDPFAAHRHQMRAMFGSFGMAPFGVTAPMQPHRAPRRQVTMTAPHRLGSYCG